MWRRNFDFFRWYVDHTVTVFIGGNPKHSMWNRVLDFPES